MIQTAQNNGNVPTLFGTVVSLIIAIAITAAVLVALEIPTVRDSQTAAAQEPLDPFDGLTIEAKAAIVIDIRSGEVLYEKNADVQLPIASLTKVPLVLAVAEVLSPNTLITIPYYASGTGENGHLTKGEIWRVRDVIDFTLIASSNNGAEILADAANEALHERYPESPEHSAALWRMNTIAQELGLNHTYFLNVSGLDISQTQSGAFGSARDMATLYAYAVASEPSLFAATARDHVLLTAISGSAQSALNTNDAQGAIVGLIMGKTGITDLAGGNLAVVFDVGLAHPVVAVVLGSSEQGRFTDTQKLVEAGRTSVTGWSPNQTKETPPE